MAWSKNWTLPTNFNNNNPFDVNSVLTPNMFNVPYQNTLYLIDRVGTIETSITTKENALKEADKKTLYNLGAYDSVSTSNGITTITRQTGYLTLNGSTDFETGWVSSGNGYYLFSKLLVNADKSLVSNVKINCNVSNNQDTYFNTTFSNYLVCVGNSYTGEGRIIIGYGGDTTASALRTHLSQNPLIIQYKLATSYTEQVIEGQPLNTLDQAQSQIVREDVESGRNLLDLENTQAVTIDTVGNIIPYNARCSCFAKVEPNTTYTIKPSSIGQYMGIRIGIHNFTNSNIGTSTHISDSGWKQLTNTSYTFTTTSNCYYLGIVISFSSTSTTVITDSTEVSNLDVNYVKNNIKLMLVKGSNPPTAYSPYNANKHITNQEAKFLASEYLKSSNLLNIADKETTSYNGITYSISNGEITLNGKPTTDYWLTIDFNKSYFENYSGTLTFKSFVSNTTNDFELRFIPYDNGSSSRFYEFYTNKSTNNRTYTFTNSTGWYCQLHIITNQTFDNFKIKPMLIEGTTIPTTFEPYHGEIVHKKELEEISARLDELGFREATISYSDTSGVSPQANSIIKQGQMCLLDFWIANTNGLNKSGTLTIPEGFRPQSDRLVRFYIYSRQFVEGQYILTGQYLTLTLTSSGIIEYDFTSSFVALFAIASSSGWKIND